MSLLKCCVVKNVQLKICEDSCAEHDGFKHAQLYIACLCICVFILMYVQLNSLSNLELVFTLICTLWMGEADMLVTTGCVCLWTC